MIIYLHTSRFTSRQRVAWGGVLCGLLVIGAASLAISGSPLRGSPVRPLHDAVTAFPPTDGIPPMSDPRGHPTLRANRATAVHAAAPQGASDPQAPAPSFQYVGHWKEQGATTVVLSERGRNLLVRVPGPFDERYQVLAVDEHRLIMKYLPLGIVQTLTLSPGAPWMMRSPARPVPAEQATTAPTPAPRKVIEVPSSMEAPGLPVTPVAMPIGTAPRPASSNERDSEPEN